jgi:hypothetical protein
MHLRRGKPSEYGIRLREKQNSKGFMVCSKGNSEDILKSQAVQSKTLVKF